MDLVALPASRLRNVEIVDITGSGGNSLRVGWQDVLDMSWTDTLRVDGNIGDIVLRGPGRLQVTDALIDGNTYLRYTRGATALLMDIDVTSII